jgi:hypothetical protein
VEIDLAEGIQGYTDASRKPLMEAFNNFARTNKTVVFIGKSYQSKLLISMNHDSLTDLDG